MTQATPASLVHRVHRTAAARRAKSAARRVIDACVERYLNIDCTPPDPVHAEGQFGDSQPYGACDYPFLLKCLNVLDLRSDDVAFEIGCGLGRALCLMARRPVARCVGIELSPALAQRARANVQSLRPPKAPTEVIAGDAACVDYSDGTAFYLFNPFGAATMRSVLDNIQGSLARNPRPVRFIYLNPFFDDLFQASGWLVRQRQVKSAWSNTYASYWASNGHETLSANPMASR